MRRLERLVAVEHLRARVRGDWRGRVAVLLHSGAGLGAPFLTHAAVPGDHIVLRHVELTVENV